VSLIDRQKGSSKKWVVITTINPPTRTIEVVSALCDSGWSAVVVGDTKTPVSWSARGVDFLSVDRQRELFGAYADLLPYRHYCRKNLGYLYAMQNGAELIIDTDDDNIPFEEFGKGIQRTVTGKQLSGPGWINVYKWFVDKLQIWPRGLPLDAIDHRGTLSAADIARDCPIQQFLADNDPDVDAIFRLTNKGQFFFNKGAKPIILDRDAWVPFNSQNTVFFPEAFELLYLPCYVSFRMTDIWRSFVAQAALWRCGSSFSFHAATVEQIRNEHDLMKDFADEVVGYLENRKIASTLTEASKMIQSGIPVAAVALELWESLEKIGIVPAKEMPIIRGWFELCKSLRSPHAAQLLSA
jgi:hypothetical protein